MPPKPAGLGRVSVQPNSCQIRGRVLHIRPESGNSGAVWDVAVSATDDIPGSPNFAARHVGDTIQLFVHPEMAGAVTEGEFMSATVSYRGDERGGRFAVVAPVSEVTPRPNSRAPVAPLLTSTFGVTPSE